jgi:hypothetical protein
MPLPALVQSMLRPDFHPSRPAAVELRQTHISYVVLAGDDVYKVKKPVRFTFLDFSTLERRREACHDEVRLNRRLAPDVYLGVVGLRECDGGHRLCDESDPAAIEFAVHMRRLSDERTLEHLLDHGEVPEGAIERLAALLADFHRRAAADDAVTANGAPDAVWRILRDNYDGVAPFRGVTVSAADDDAIQAFARGFLRDHDALFRRRQAERRIRDGHGDLHVDHVYLAEPPVIVDCVEFNPRFRWCDVASDLAFLFMDLEFHGRPDLAARLVDRYARVTGDGELPALVPFYACYRAYVRGKVNSLKSDEAEVDEDERRQALEQARRRFVLAYRYTWAYTPRLVVITGLSGTGKSTVARRLAERTGFALITSDEVRKELAGVAATERLRGDRQAALYSADMSRRTYAELYARAERSLRAGRGAILDATFQLRRGRDRARAIADRASVAMRLFECRAGDDIIRRRLGERARRDDDASDADWAVYLEQKRRHEPFEAEEERRILDTTLPLDDVIVEIERALRAARA